MIFDKFHSIPYNFIEESWSVFFNAKERKNWRIIYVKAKFYAIACDHSSLFLNAVLFNKNTKKSLSMYAILRKTHIINIKFVIWSQYSNYRQNVSHGTVFVVVQLCDKTNSHSFDIVTSIQFVTSNFVNV